MATKVEMQDEKDIKREELLTARHDVLKRLARLEIDVEYHKNEVAEQNHTKEEETHLLETTKDLERFNKILKLVERKIEELK